MTVEIVDENTHRALAYLEALNRQGVKPSRAQLDSFAEQPQRRVSRRNGIADFASLRDRVVGEVVEKESYSSFLARVGWIDGEPGVGLTAMGRALLKGLNSPALDESTSDLFEIVLNPENPFAYAQALQGLGSTGPAMLVEPYFRLDQLMAIAELENIDRVLMSPKVSQQDRNLVATGLAALPANHPLQIRVVDDLHDRYLIPHVDEAVLMLGSSLGGVGKKVSTLTTLGVVASQALREAHESLWQTATSIEPVTAAYDSRVDRPSTGNEASHGAGD